MAEWPEDLQQATFLFHAFSAREQVSQRTGIAWSVLQEDWLSQRRRTLVHLLATTGLIEVQPQPEEPSTHGWKAYIDGGGPVKDTPQDGRIQGGYAYSARSPTGQIVREAGGPLPRRADSSLGELFSAFLGQKEGPEALPRLGIPWVLGDPGNMQGELMALLRLLSDIWLDGHREGSVASAILASGRLQVVFDQEASAEVAQGGWWAAAHPVLCLLLRRVAQWLTELGLELQWYWVHSHRKVVHAHLGGNKRADSLVSFSRQLG